GGRGRGGRRASLAGPWAPPLGRPGRGRAGASVVPWPSGTPAPWRPVTPASLGGCQDIAVSLERDLGDLGRVEPRDDRVMRGARKLPEGVGQLLPRQTFGVLLEVRQDRLGALPHLVEERSDVEPYPRDGTDPAVEQVVVAGPDGCADDRLQVVVEGGPLPRGPGVGLGGPDRPARDLGVRPPRRLGRGDLQNPRQ